MTVEQTGALEVAQIIFVRPSVYERHVQLPSSRLVFCRRKHFESLTHKL